MFADLIKGRISDPTVQRAFDYWSTMTSLDKWFALPPGTPEPMIRAHRAAYEAASAGTDTSKGCAYDAVADARSWTAMKTFFDELFSARR